jgi:hypothetical protein
MPVLQTGEIITAFVHDSIAVLIIAGAWIEGIRLPQMFFIASFVVQQIVCLSTGCYLYPLFYAGAFLSIYQVARYGEGDFSKLKLVVPTALAYGILRQQSLETNARSFTQH